jgi:hypothetical protein
MSQKPNVLILGEACRFFPESAQVIDEDAMAFFLSIPYSDQAG